MQLSYSRWGEPLSQTLCVELLQMVWTKPGQWQMPQAGDDMEPEEMSIAAPGAIPEPWPCAVEPVLEVSPHLELFGWQRYPVQSGLEPHCEFLRHLLTRLAIEGLPLASRQRDTRHPATILTFVDRPFMIRAAFRHGLCSSCVVCVLP